MAHVLLIGATLTLLAGIDTPGAEGYAMVAVGTIINLVLVPVFVLRWRRRRRR